MQALEADGAAFWVSRQILREYLAAMTRPDALTKQVDRSEMVRFVRFVADDLGIIEDGPAVTEKLLALVEKFNFGGKQVHDANIVATMQAHGIRRLLTHNVSDFQHFSGVIDVLPLQQAQEE